MDYSSKIVLPSNKIDKVEIKAKENMLIIHLSGSNDIIVVSAVFNTLYFIEAEKKETKRNE